MALAALLLALLAGQLLAHASRVRRSVRERGALQCVFDAAKRLPIIRGIVKREQEKMVVRTLNPYAENLKPLGPRDLLSRRGPMAAHRSKHLEGRRKWGCAP